ncbi:hypothetical protein M409DRAFT_26808 [Zasmidium cellare ATCC 36951]|uniref:Uncharacterized protein n=1 Tax=Zasmidium cellare ATCC 36951 TaxID=1080233 RepID=A0A6A6CBX8_ZASCE|nr:uncharacterized protein M409DRAFT_26808 [Zasmidium cellare ATCC 36951]KAF2162956.1 hypothetical protein M409DRAFT_26808 [Zasmidium cellare ATCC 36951]
MPRFEVMDSSPHPTPVVEESEFEINSIRSTPCPGRGLFPQGPGSDSLDVEEDDISEAGTLVLDSMEDSNDQGDQHEQAEEQDHRPEQAQEQQSIHLRASLITLREALINSTALVNTLRTRNDFFRAENSAKEAQLKEFRKARDGAQAVVDSEIEDREASKRFVVLVAAIVVVVGVGYVYCCWCHGPEMQYVLRRRREGLGI